jgi:hypothetical protein
MNITNQHQPYIFKNQNNEINIIVSEFMGVGITFEFGDYISSEDKWKLHLLDSNFTKTIINTPETLTYNDITYDVIAECNGYIEDNIISYVIGGFDKLNSYYTYYLVTGNFDSITNTVTNLEVLGNYRTGFYKQNDIYTYFNHTIVKNNLPLNINLEPHISLIVRIIPVYGHNKMLITGLDETGINNITLLYDIDTNNVKKLTTPDTEYIYKSSIYDFENIKMMAYTDKVFHNTNNGRFELTQPTFNYNLMVDSDFILSEI